MLKTERMYDLINELLLQIVSQSILYIGLDLELGIAIDIVLGAVPMHRPLEEELKSDKVVMVHHLFVDILLWSGILWFNLHFLNIKYQFDAIR